MSMKQKSIEKSNRRKSTPKLDFAELRKLLCEAGRDSKEEALKRLIADLKPVLLELMKNKSWSSRKTAQFFKERKIIVRACDIGAFIKANPFTGEDADALLKLKIDCSKTGTQKGSGI
jgi:hypothetical protein